MVVVGERLFVSPSQAHENRLNQDKTRKGWGKAVGVVFANLDQLAAVHLAICQLNGHSVALCFVQQLHRNTQSNRHGGSFSPLIVSRVCVCVCVCVRVCV